MKEALDGIEGTLDGTTLFVDGVSSENVAEVRIGNRAYQRRVTEQDSLAGFDNRAGPYDFCPTVSHTGGKITIMRSTGTETYVQHVDVGYLKRFWGWLDGKDVTRIEMTRDRPPEVVETFDNIRRGFAISEQDGKHYVYYG